MLWAQARGLTSVSQRESPESQVGSSVGDTAQTKLNGVDGLVDEHLSKIKLKQTTSMCILKENKMVKPYKRLQSWGHVKK